MINYIAITAISEPDKWPEINWQITINAGRRTTQTIIDTTAQAGVEAIASEVKVILDAGVTTSHWFNGDKIDNRLLLDRILGIYRRGQMRITETALGLVPSNGMLAKEINDMQAGLESEPAPTTKPRLKPSTTQQFTMDIN